MATLQSFAKALREVPRQMRNALLSRGLDGAFCASEAYHIGKPTYGLFFDTLDRLFRGFNDAIEAIIIESLKIELRQTTIPNLLITKIMQPVRCKIALVQDQIVKCVADLFSDDGPLAHQIEKSCRIIEKLIESMAKRK